jgi:ornithine decarboxylase
MQKPAAPTPFLLLDLGVVAERYRELRAALPDATVLYAVKANPTEEVVRLLGSAGSSFDVASPGEIDLCLRCGISPERLSYGNTIKKESDIRRAFNVGVRTFTVDADLELDKIIRHAPGSTVFVRISTDGVGADWPLSKKFGCPFDSALAILRKAASAGHPVGVSFHVGSQQRNPRAWRTPLAQVGQLGTMLADDGIALAGINLGGGLPASYLDPAPCIEQYGSAIQAALTETLETLGTCPVQLFVEPGRYLVGDAGIIETEVVLIAYRPDASGDRWVYLDIGLFNGLAETLDEAIRYRIRVPGRCGRAIPTVLAGPTCDSADVLYEQHRYLLPADLSIGDRVQLLSTGAYTSSYSTVNFNGFEPLRGYVVGRSAHGGSGLRRSNAVPGQRHEVTSSRTWPE